ncbi:MAG: hypothetical protein AAGL90_17505, partial [Pseudomonadota bacterium]
MAGTERVVCFLDYENTRFAERLIARFARKTQLGAKRLELVPTQLFVDSEKRASVDGVPLARVFSWSFAGWPLAG